MAKSQELYALKDNASHIQHYLTNNAIVFDGEAHQDGDRIITSLYHFLKEGSGVPRKHLIIQGNPSTT